MRKVYPKGEVDKCSSSSATTELTVWKKSLLFNCNGFTVFDSKGDLIFRVDNYMEGHRGEILLMDAAGKPLLTIRRKKLSLGDCWVVFDGETTSNPLFSTRKNVNILNWKRLAYASNQARLVLYEIEGSYGKRCCTVYDDKRRKMAEVRSKEAAVGGVTLGCDVFRLIVHPGLDTATAMSLVILLDQMFGS